MKGSYEDQELSNLISAAKSSNILWTAIPSNDLKTVKTLAAEHLPDIRLARFDSLSRREGMLLIELETLPSDAAIALKTGRAFLLFSTRNGPSYLLEPYQTTPML